MPAIAAIAINDGAASPVSHTFNVVSTDGARGKWADRSPGIPTGFLTISHEVRNASSPSAAERIIMGFNVPVMATADGVTSVVRNSSAQVTLNLSPSSTEQERKDLLAYVANFLANASVKTSVQNIEPFY